MTQKREIRKFEFFEPNALSLTSFKKMSLILFGAYRSIHASRFSSNLNEVKLQIANINRKINGK